MGQYFKAIFLEKDRKTIANFAESYDYDSGAKMMEHSYLRNPFVLAVIEHLQKVNGANLVWAGDYADGEKEKRPLSEVRTVWQGLVADGKTVLGLQDYYFSEDPDTYSKERGENLYALADETDKKIGEQKKADTDYLNIRFIVNEDKKQYVDLWRVPTMNGWAVHPLPILTSEGNGSGGGDYAGINMKYVGAWARDFITVKDGYWGEGGYTEIMPNFVEAYNVVSELHTIQQILKQAFDEEANGDTGWSYASDDTFIKGLKDAVTDIESVIPKKAKK